VFVQVSSVSEQQVRPCVHAAPVNPVQEGVITASSTDTAPRRGHVGSVPSAEDIAARWEWRGNVRAKLLIVSVAAALMFSLGASGAHAGSTNWLTCKGLSGRMVLTPGLPQLGHVDRVRPAVAIKNAKLTGCSGKAKRGTASATLKFAKATNCTTLIQQISTNVAATAAGTMTIGWTAGHASTIALKVRFGAVSGSPSLATVSGSVTSGQFKGAKPSGNIEWSIGPSECFGGQPLTTFDFSLYTLAVAS